MGAVDVQLGPARVLEAPALAEISRRLIEQGLVWRWRPAAIARLVRSAHCEVVVARRSSEILGFGALELGLDTAHLVLLGVIPPARRTGVGRALVEYLTRMAETAGIEAIRLEVRATNTGARAFYAELGYREVARLPGYYSGREAAVRMSRRL